MPLKNDCVWCGAINALGARRCLQCGHIPDVPKILCNCAQCRKAEERGETPWLAEKISEVEGLRVRDDGAVPAADSGFNSRPLPIHDDSEAGVPPFTVEDVDAQPDEEANP